VGVLATWLPELLRWSFFTLGMLGFISAQLPFRSW
jgi:hypothetical protein